ncbi:hypothetical protein [Loigolactobacillus bifermentans]|nr:hypothetical protein [Loigolactobacillus bifermentans]QGG61712.1 hypothetical protein LB003_15250 [Loigolactobacillus bifermentans]
MQTTQLMAPTWWQLTAAKQEQVFRQLLRYFVSPLLTIQNVTPYQFQFFGHVRQTMAVQIQGMTYVLVPGAQQVTLGWQQGLGALDLAEVIQNQQGTAVLTTAQARDLINANTSPQRVVDMPPLLVGQQAWPLAWQPQGLYEVVTGKFSGNVFFGQQVLPQIQALLQQPQPSLDPFEQAPPLQTENLQLVQMTDGEHYLVFARNPENTTATAIEADRQQLGFQLPTVDQWEYLAGAGTRNLFNWGNQVQPTGVWAQEANPFGLQFAQDQRTLELTHNPAQVKLGTLPVSKGSLLSENLPLSPYFQPTVAHMAQLPLVATYRDVAPIHLETEP